jgi:trehalose/maltose hydrolase-like predicted phosphorylase
MMTQNDPLDTFSPSRDSRWTLEIEGFDTALEPTIEAVFATVNGYLGTRAALEEGSAVSCPQTFIAGVFNTPAQPQTPELEEPIPELVVAPDWSRLRIGVAGQELRLDRVELLGQRRVLDMRQGVLLRETRVRDSAGRVTSLRSLRFASLDNRHALAQLLMLVPENYSGAMTLESLVDGRVTNENKTVHLAALTRGPSPAAAGEGSEILTVRTLQSGYELAFAAHADLRDAMGGSIAGDAIQEPGLIGQRWEWQAEQGHVYELRKLVAVVTSRDTATPVAEAQELLKQLVQMGGAALINAQARAWADRWETSDAAIAGDAEIQREVRFALYHLIGAAHAGDERSSVGARSLTGERYRGHVFWDNETFVWPFYLFTDPLAARALLIYRYHTIAGAREKARAMGYRGALYAWESADTGEETTPPFIRGPRGDRLPILTGIEEHHISADIAYAIVQYRQATGDEQFFLDYGAEMLLDIARFWASRATHGADGRYHILKVIGPDEYHESVDDNAYTNVMAQWTLRRGLEAAAELQANHAPRWASLASRLGLAAEELEEWRRVADGLATGFDTASGLFEQFRGYYDLREIDLSGHDSGKATLDKLMPWQEVRKTKALKQADVVLLMFLLWDSFPARVRAANFRYYQPRTTHDSSLSASIHALVAARLGDMPLAERFLRQAARIDLDFTRKGWAGATGGVHIAALGGIWQALAFGFLGMRPHDEGLRFDPHVPRAWGSLRMPIRWRGSQLRVTATSRNLEIAVEAGEPAMLAYADGPWQEVRAGGALRAKL